MIASPMKAGDTISNDSADHYQYCTHPTIPPTAVKERLYVRPRIDGLKRLSISINLSLGRILSGFVTYDGPVAEGGDGSALHFPYRKASAPYSFG